MTLQSTLGGRMKQNETNPNVFAETFFLSWQLNFNTVVPKYCAGGRPDHLAEINIVCFKDCGLLD